MPMLPTDARSEWDASIFDDPRAINLWDEHRVLGTWLGEHDELRASRLGPIVWDAYLLFDKDARWNAAPASLLDSGSPVIGETSKLAAAIAPLLATP